MKIASDTRVYVIAEVGPNHNGSLETALEFVRRLAPLGIDAVKFQIANPENFYSNDAFKADYQIERDGAGSAIEMSRRVQLSREAHQQLYADCRNAGVDYLCTAFDLESLRFLDESFDLPYIKVASSEILSLDILEYLAARDRPILLSTGMATFEEIEQAIDVLEEHSPKDITVLHCVSSYPAPNEDIHLNVIPGLRTRFGRPVGYSDHSLGPECCLGAVALGATVIEKHVTLDKNMPGPDHKASATIDEFAEFVTSLRSLEAALGGREKVFSSTEEAIKRMARKSIIAARDVAAGEILKPEDICFKRPGTGLAPSERNQVIGQTAVRPIKANTIISPTDLV